MTRTSVSVVVPAHNSSSTIVRCLESAIHQTRPPREIIVVNDASTDDTLKIVEDFARTSPVPIRIQDFEVNRGPGAARNAGWDMANGDYVAFLDADDAWHPSKIEIQSDLMERNPSTVMSCHSHHFGIDDPWVRVDTDFDVSAHDLGDFLWRNRCATPTVMFRTSVRERFDQSSVVIGVEDYLLWMQVVSNHGPCLKASLPLTHCSNPAFGGTGLSGRMLAMERGELAVLRKLFAEGHIGRSRLLIVTVWSIAKFVIRLIDQRGLRIRSRRR